MGDFTTRVPLGSEINSDYSQIVLFSLWCNFASCTYLMPLRIYKAGVTIITPTKFVVFRNTIEVISKERKGLLLEKKIYFGSLLLKEMIPSKLTESE